MSHEHKHRLFEDAAGAWDSGIDNSRYAPQILGEHKVKFLNAPPPGLVAAPVVVAPVITPPMPPAAPRPASRSKTFWLALGILWNGYDKDFKSAYGFSFKFVAVTLVVATLAGIAYATH